MNEAVPLVWLVTHLALESLRHGVILVGSPGSGKGILLKAFRGSLATLMAKRPSCDIHLVDFDSKKDLYDLHRAFPDPIFDLNPFVWGDVYDPLGEVDDPRDIAEIVAQIVEVGTNSSQPFFPQAARLVLRARATRHWLVARGGVISPTSSSPGPTPRGSGWCSGVARSLKAFWPS